MAGGEQRTSDISHTFRPQQDSTLSLLSLFAFDSTEELTAHDGPQVKHGRFGHKENSLRSVSPTSWPPDAWRPSH
jgi:hypothetical protein